MTLDTAKLSVSYAECRYGECRDSVLKPGANVIKLFTAVI